MATSGTLCGYGALGGRRLAARALCAALVGIAVCEGVSHADATWWATCNSAHQDAYGQCICTAGHISTGSIVADSAGPYWDGAGHSYFWHLPASDTDCCKPCAGIDQYIDQSAPYPSGFKSYWTLMKYNSSTQTWGNHFTDEIDGVTDELFTEGAARTWYMWKCSVDDKPDTDPRGDDDSTAEISSAAFEVVYPYPLPSSWGIDDGYPKEDPDEEGTILTHYHFSSSCGHLVHLNHALQREYVTYQSGANPYVWPGDNGQPWDFWQPNPIALGGSAVSGGGADRNIAGDFHPKSQITSGAAFSTYQVFQYRTDDMPEGDWYFLGGPYTILRSVEQVGNDWIYTGTKHGFSLNYTIP